MSTSLFPPPLVLQASASIAADSEAQPGASLPNLMPFSIEYTGPANVDGYLVVHRQGDLSSATSSSSSNGASNASSSSSDPLVSHFRGRRLFATDVPLPTGWSGNVFTIRKEQRQAAQHDAGADAGPSNGASAEEEEERRDLMRRREKKRRLEQRKAAAAPPKPAAKAKASFAAFSMDDDDDEDGDEGHGEGDDMAGESEQDFDTEDKQDLDRSPTPLSEDEDDDAYASQDAASQVKLDNSASTQPSIVTSLQALPASRFNAIRIWNPDGPLDQGDDDFVKVLREQTALAEMVSRTRV